MQLLPFLVLVAFVFGAMVGSFLNVVIYRVPRGLSVAKPKRSFCPSCREQIPAINNIPIVSWVVLNGRCARCKATIPMSYFLVELATASLFAVIAVVHLRGVVQPGFPQLAAVAIDCLVAALIVAITLIDFRHAIIPDPLTVPWLPVLIVAVYCVPGLLRGRWLVAAVGQEYPRLALALAGVALGMLPALLADFLARVRDVTPPGEDPQSALPTDDEQFSIWSEARFLLLPALLPALVGAVAMIVICGGRVASGTGLSAAIASAAGVGAGLLVIYVVRFVFSALFRREAMGLGDAKFLALAGAVLGAEGTVAVFFLACALGSLPALVGLFGRLPGTTGMLIGSSLVPFLLMRPLAERIGPQFALPLLAPIPLLGLVLFLRRLRTSDAPMAAVPFGPFLALASLVLLLAYRPIMAWL